LEQRQSYLLRLRVIDRALSIKRQSYIHKALRWEITKVNI